MSALNFRHRFLVAVCEWIANHINRARTDCSMVLGRTLRGLGAWIRDDTWIDAHMITACLSCGTIVVRLTSRLIPFSYWNG